MTSVNDIRSLFLDFFIKNGHEEVSSSSLVPHNDPTLMFTNSGMVQFKNVFTGLEKRDYKRATTSQKCVRAGGKHNDLENVGYTSRHHTFFEMLGNFSFGDYFKDFAIEQAWNLVTKELGLNPSKLLVTVFHEDLEAQNLWKKIANLPDQKIIKIATSDNFWSMGDLGPCGPCSEIFYDHGEEIQGGPPGSENEDGDRFVEIWNLVFMQYEQLSSGRIDLPKPSIDTGMGLERIAAILQGKHDNYDIDILKKIMEASAEISNRPIDKKFKNSHKVIADHLRASGFLISDGVLPSNEGRGYVLRRIMRRAMRHFHQLGCSDPQMFKLVPVLINEMGMHYKELVRAEALITETLKLEETRFKEALERGMKILNSQIEKNENNKTLDGNTAFKLYDTYGFPLDLTEDFMRGYGWKVDLKSFHGAMEKQKQIARQAWTGSGGVSDNVLFLDLKEKYGNTEFLGYSSFLSDSIIQSLIVDNKIVNEVSEGQEVLVLANQTPFYAESGGQLGDTGTFNWNDGKAKVLDTQKESGIFLHKLIIESGKLKIGDIVSMSVDFTRRQALCCNHSATHLLHEALRQVLGKHVVQKGSLVSPDRLRFDFSHPKSISIEEKNKIENIINFQIRKNLDVKTQITSQKDAIDKGALALFGEKYGDEVRVVLIGENSHENKKDAWSVELCGGTHVTNTSEIILFRMLSETAVSSGVRRIEALTHLIGFDWLVRRDKTLAEISSHLKSSSDEIVPRIQQMSEEKQKLINEISLLKKKLIQNDISKNNNVEKIRDISFINRTFEDTSPKDLKSISDSILKDNKNSIVCLFSILDNKCSIVVAISEDILDQFDAVNFIKIATEILGGKGGGGRRDLAQSGGPKIDQVNNVIIKFKNYIESK